MAEILEFTGTLTPDSTGDFVETGVYAGYPYFWNSAKGFFLYYDPSVFSWYVSVLLGIQGDDGFWCTDSMINSHYEPFEPVTGIGDMHLKAGYHIYRGQDGDIDYGNIQAEMPLGAPSVTIPNQVLPPGTIWHYVRRQISDYGKESKDSPLCKVVIDAAGDMVPLCPNPPMDLLVVPDAGGKFKLRWRYNAIDQEILPSGFKIYLVDDGEWSLLDTILCLIGGYGEFQWTSSAFEDGQSCSFCVHSYAEGFGESQNTNLVSATADAVGPPVITGLEAVVEEV